MRYEARKVELGASSLIHLLRTVEVLLGRVLDDVYLDNRQRSILEQVERYVIHMERMVSDAAYALKSTPQFFDSAPEEDGVGEGPRPSYGPDGLGDRWGGGGADED